MDKPTAPAAENENKDSESKQSFTQKLRQKTIKAAGAGFLFADSSLIMSGLLAGDGKISSAGVFGLTAGVVGTRYGNPKAEKQLELLNRKLGSYLRKQGVTIPKDSSTEELTKQGGMLEHIESFLYNNPSQIMNIFYSLIGVQFARAGRQHHDNKLVASGGLLISGALAGILIPERKPDPDNPPKGAAQKTWSLIQEKPLRLTSTLFNLNQVSLALSALDDRKRNPRQKSYIFKLMAVAGFVFGNTMLALSSKSEAGNNALNKKTISPLVETSARVIAAQPKEMQATLLDQVAGFLSSQPNVHMKANEMSAMLHNKLTEVVQNPSLGGNWQEHVTASKDTPSHQPAR